MNTRKSQEQLIREVISREAEKVAEAIEVEAIKILLDKRIDPDLHKRAIDILGMEVELRSETQKHRTRANLLRTHLEYIRDCMAPGDYVDCSQHAARLAQAALDEDNRLVNGRS